MMIVIPTLLVAGLFVFGMSMWYDAREESIKEEQKTSGTSRPRKAQ